MKAHLFMERLVAKMHRALCAVGWHRTYQATHVNSWAWRCFYCEADMAGRGPFLSAHEMGQK